MRFRWYFTPVYYVAGLLLGLLLAIVVNLFVHSISMSWLLSADSVVSVLVIGFLALPSIILWVMLMLANRWVESRSEKAVVILPMGLGVILVLVGLFLALPAIMEG